VSGIDPYLTLGIEPAADDAAIRAAYRAAMKRYHPDQNPSSDAAERVRGVTAAYKLLTDPEQRARFDRQRTLREQMIAPRPPQPPRSAPRGQLFGVVLVILSLAIVGFAWARLDRPQTPTAPHRTTPSQEATPPRDVPPEIASPVTPQTAPIAVAPASPRVAEITPSPVPTPPLPIPPAAATPVERGVPQRPASAPLPVATPGHAFRPAPPAGLAVRVAIAKPIPKSPLPAGDECDTAASCARIDLAALDRMQTMLYNQSYLNASSVKQARLLSGRLVFLARLGRCSSAACKRDAYLARNREIADLMRS